MTRDVVCINDEPLGSLRSQEGTVRGTPAKTFEHLQSHVKSCEVHFEAFEATLKPSKSLQTLVYLLGSHTCLMG